MDELADGAVQGTPQQDTDAGKAPKHLSVFGVFLLPVALNIAASFYLL